MTQPSPSPSPSPSSNSEGVPSKPFEPPELPPCTSRDLKEAPDIGTPGDYGLPPKFREFRPVQRVALSDILERNGRRAFVICMPTGTGKTVVCMTAAEMLEYGRVAYLTSTKALTKQLMDDFHSLGMKEVKGRNSFKCLTDKEVTVNWKTGEKRKATCEDGGKVKCPFRDPMSEAYGMYRCPYKLHVDEARGARLVTVNYHYWITVNMFAWNEKEECNPLGPFDLLILDEAHDLITILSDFAKIQVTAADFREMLDRAGLEIKSGSEDWGEWARFSGACADWIRKESVRLSRLIDMVEPPPREFDDPEPEYTLDELNWFRGFDDLYEDREEADKKRKEEAGAFKDQIEAWGPLAARFALIVEVALSDGLSNWVIDWDGKQQSSVEFNPIDLKRWSERFLFAHVPKLLVPSATVRAKTMDMLGLGRGQYWFREYPSPFKRENVPVFWIPTARIDYRSEKEEGTVLRWIRTIDSIIEPRVDRKGIIHTVSYPRASRIMNGSRFRDMMTVTGQGRVVSDVAWFRRRPDPAILLSPALTTGYDFPLDECEYIIVAKVPFPDLSSMSKVMKIRNQRDKGYTSYLTIQTLVQECGRGARGPGDKCEVFIVDDHVQYMLWGKSAREGLVPRWFLGFARRADKAPEPGPPLLGHCLEGGSLND